jgi:hypothetical protein
MLGIAGEYEETGVEPFRGQLICEPMRDGKAMAVQLRSGLWEDPVYTKKLTLLSTNCRSNA